MLVDDLGDWRGLGTAVHLAESGHRVTLVTAAAAAGAALAHSAVDGLLRGRFARAGGVTVPSTVVTRWSSDGARLRSLLTGQESTVAAPTLVIAETARPLTDLADALPGNGFPAQVHLVGDCVAARRGWLAIYEGRRLAQSL